MQTRSFFAGVGAGIVLTLFVSWAGHFLTHAVALQELTRGHVVHRMKEEMPTCANEGPRFATQPIFICTVQGLKTLEHHRFFSNSKELLSISNLPSDGALMLGSNSKGYVLQRGRYGDLLILDRYNRQYFVVESPDPVVAPWNPF